MKNKHNPYLDALKDLSYDNEKAHIVSQTRQYIKEEKVGTVINTKEKFATELLKMEVSFVFELNKTTDKAKMVTAHNFDLDIAAEGKEKVLDNLFVEFITDVSKVLTQGFKEYIDREKIDLYLEPEPEKDE